MRYSIIIIFSLSLINADIHVFNRSTGTQSHIKTLSNSKPLYISAKDIGSSFTSKVYENSERQKTVSYTHLTLPTKA